MSLFSDGVADNSSSSFAALLAEARQELGEGFIVEGAKAVAYIADFFAAMSDDQYSSETLFTLDSLDDCMVAVSSFTKTGRMSDYEPRVSLGIESFFDTEADGTLTPEGKQIAQEHLNRGGALSERIALQWLADRYALALGDIDGASLMPDSFVDEFDEPLSIVVARLGVPQMLKIPRKPRMP